MTPLTVIDLDKTRVSDFKKSLISTVSNSVFTPVCLVWRPNFTWPTFGRRTWSGTSRSRTTGRRTRACGTCTSTSRTPCGRRTCPGSTTSSCRRELVLPPGHALRVRPARRLPLLPPPQRHRPHAAVRAPHGHARRARGRGRRRRPIPRHGRAAHRVAVTVRERGVEQGQRLPPDVAIPARREEDTGHRARPP
jgi:hypothetical protein